MDLFQHNTLAALMSGLYEGTMTIHDLLTHGDFGIGTLAGINGELIILDGKAFVASADNTVRSVQPDEVIPYGAVTHYEPSISFLQENPINSEPLFHTIENSFPSKNTFYAIKLTGSFQQMQVRMSPGGEEGEPFVKITEHQPEYTENNIKGSAIGFWTPEMFHGVSVAGYHLHFLSDAQNFGGHILDFSGFEGSVEVSQVERLIQSFPIHSQNFLSANLDLDKLKSDIRQAE